MSRYFFPTRVLQLRHYMLIIVVTLLIMLYRRSEYLKLQMIGHIPASASTYLFFEESDYPPINLSYIRLLIKDHNSNETILNNDTFGPVKRNSVFLVVQVNKMSINLKSFIMSLSQVRGIEDTLVIFSHSYYDLNVNKLIGSIDFCQVLQIFFPYSLQANPDNFPGYHPDDCHNNMGPRKAKMLNCTGAYTPDVHGRYRNPEVVEKKHHWWWTANQVFENIKNSEDHEGLVVFLEDDLYLLEDFLYMLLYMKDATKSLAQCEFLCLAPQLEKFSENISNHIQVSTWDPRHHTEALAFDLQVWNKIVSHYDIFCNHDDSSWAQSLWYMSLNFRDNSEKFKVMTSTWPRAYKIKVSGYFLQNKIMQKIVEIVNMQWTHIHLLYPHVLEVYTHIDMPTQDYKYFFGSEPQGGWGDPRDHQLCANMTTRKIKKVMFDMEVKFRDTNNVNQFY